MAAVIAEAHAAGAVVLASAGGSSEIPYAEGTAVSYGRAAALWVRNNLLDGLDFNFENIKQGFTGGRLVMTGCLEVGFRTRIQTADLVPLTR